MVEDLPAAYVPRPQEFGALIDKLLDQRREEPVAIMPCCVVRELRQNDDGDGLLP